MADLLGGLWCEKAEKNEVNIHIRYFINNNSQKATIIDNTHKSLHTCTNVKAQNNTYLPLAFEVAQKENSSIRERPFIYLIENGYR